MHTQSMLTTHPRNVDNLDALVACIEACFDCAQTCTTCADACLAEDNVQRLVRCIRLNLDCADVCATTGQLLSRQTDADWSLLRAQLEACETACRLCAEACEQHADMHEHCRICADACRQCETSCQSLLESISAVT